MTLVVIWHSGTEITALADTRISSAGRTATDAGSKLFTITLAVQTLSPDFKNETAQHSLGLAFAGSTLLANNCHGIASSLTQQLRSPSKPFLPSMYGVAQIYAAVGKHVTADFNSRKANSKDWTFFEAAIFGYCKVANDLRVYHLKPDMSGGTFSMSTIEYTMLPSMVVTLGSGSSLFHEFRVEEAAVGRGSAQSLFKRVVDSGKLKDVGGYAQYAKADAHGARMVPTIIQSPTDPDKKTLSVLGFDIWSLGEIEGLDFGQEAFSAGDEAVSGRLALRAKGIDPDGPVSRELQNWASIEGSVQTMFRFGAVVMLTGTYTLAQFDLHEGERYFVTPCPSCRRNNPLCADPSDGNWRGFTGPGRLQIECRWCGSSVIAGPATISSQVWGASDTTVQAPGLPGGPPL